MISIFALFPTYSPQKLLTEPPFIKHEYRGQYLKSRCDVTNAVIIVKIFSFNTIRNIVVISGVSYGKTTIKFTCDICRSCNTFTVLHETRITFQLWFILFNILFYVSCNLFLFCKFVNMIILLFKSWQRTPQVGKLLSYVKRSLLNSFWSSDAIWRRWIWSALVQVMASGTKP